MASANSSFVYQIDLPEYPQAVVFVNGFLARNRCSSARLYVSESRNLWTERGGDGQLLALRARFETVFLRKGSSANDAIFDGKPRQFLSIQRDVPTAVQW